jgi:flavin reductase
MTVTAFSSVSLDPPLVLICTSSKSYTHALITEAGVFAVNILAAGQESVANRLAGRDKVVERFEGIEHELGGLGCPLLAGALATIECRVVQDVNAGDHVVYIGSVELCAMTERDPLLYHRNDYRGIVHGRRRDPRPT